MSDLFPRFGGYRLVSEHELLLQAALLEGKAALTAWDNWQSSVDIEVLDPDSYALLPQLYQNLLAHGVEDPHMARLKGIYRRNWYANQLQLKHLKILLSHLKNVGIEAIVLGDAVLGSCQVENYRPISSFHLLVRADELEDAVQHLTGLNWRISDTPTQLSNHLQDDRQESLYIYGHLFWASPQDYTDEQVWHYAKPSGDDLAGWRLSTTDQFLDGCVRTFFKSKSLQISGIADALMLIRESGSDLDWTRLIAQAQQYQMIMPLRNMLTLLQQVFQLSLPSWVLPTLCKMPIDRSEWLKYQVLIGDRRSSIRSILARSVSHLENKWLKLRYKPFPGRGALKSLLKPTKSVLKLGE
jgi:Uncharacterised nucleotidyltransferase